MFSKKWSNQTGQNSLFNIGIKETYVRDFPIQGFRGGYYVHIINMNIIMQ